MEEKQITIDYAEQISFMYEALQCESDDEKRKWIADAIIRLEAQENKSREVAIQEEQLNATKKIELWKVLGSIGVGVIGFAGLILSSWIKAAAHQEAIDRVASYESGDVIFTGKKWNEIGRID